MTSTIRTTSIAVLGSMTFAGALWWGLHTATATTMGPYPASEREPVPAGYAEVMCAGDPRDTAVPGTEPRRPCYVVAWNPATAITDAVPQAFAASAKVASTTPGTRLFPAPSYNPGPSGSGGGVALVSGDTNEPDNPMHDGTDGTPPRAQPEPVESPSQVPIPAGGVLLGAVLACGVHIARRK